MTLLKTLALLSALSMTCTLALSADEDLSELPENGWGTPPPRQISYKDSSKAKRPPKQKKRKIKQRDLFLIDGGAVYLRPYQGGTDFAQVVNFSDIVALLDTPNIHSPQVPYGTNKPLDFEFDWGVRGTIGYQGGQSRRTLRATYLYFQSSAHKSLSVPVTGGSPTQLIISDFFVDLLFPGLPFGAGFKNAYSKWNLHFNMLDVTFGKKYPRRGCMNFEPYVGAKGILFSENQHYTYVPYPLKEPLPTSHLKQTLDFKGVGPVGGLSLDWRLASWLSFIGNVDAALLYSSIETKRTSDNALPTIDWIGSSHDIKGSPVLEASFALKGVYCWKKGRYIDLQVGFEDHYIFEVMKHNLQNADGSTNLNLMGWFATLGFGF